MLHAWSRPTVFRLQTLHRTGCYTRAVTKGPMK